MMGTIFGCIGSGVMGSALMKAAATVADPSEIGFADTVPEKAAKAADEIGSQVFMDNREAAASSRFILIAVKPQVAPRVLQEIAPVLAQRITHGNPAVLVSVVAGLTIDSIQKTLASAAPGSAASPVIRLMPNTPALIAQGMIALSASEDTGEDLLTELEEYLSQAGLVDRVDEGYMDAITALSGSGPAFVYLFIEALADGGVRVGLPRDKALRYAARTALGAAAMVEKSGQHPGVLKDAVCSPGGTTIAGVSALEERAFRGAAIAAVEGAYKRALELH